MEENHDSRFTHPSDENPKSINIRRVRARNKK